MTRRAQLVLLAAVLIAVALVPIVLAYLQLGYHADVRASGVDADPVADARGALVPAVHEASADVPGTYRWADREESVAVVRERLAPTVDTVETGRIEAGIYRNVTYNESHVEGVAAASCPGGPGREFGPCEAVDGVVVQERAGWTHVIGVAFDVDATSQRGRTELTTVVHTADGR